MLQFFGLRRLVGQYDLLGRKSAADINDAFLGWLDQASERPFFAFLNYFDAHDPYLPPSLFDTSDSLTAEQYQLVCSWWFMDKEVLTAKEIEEAKIAYESCISYLDGQIARLFNELRRREVLDNTIVVITSDHGEMFGEHGLFGHGNCLYRPVLQVPLLILYPRKVPAGFKVVPLVSLRDIPATILDLVGPRGPHPIPGASLSRYWEEEDVGDLAASMILSEIAAPCPVPPDHGRSPVAGGQMKSLTEGGRRYILHLGNEREELYDFENDQSELDDLSRDPQNRVALQQMRQSLDEIASGGH
jgi:arylsulfatase A-like enzyme